MTGGKPVRYKYSYYQVDSCSPRELARALIHSYRIEGYYEWRVNGNNGKVQAESRRDGWRINFSVRQVILLGTPAKRIEIDWWKDTNNQDGQNHEHCRSCH